MRCEQLNGLNVCCQSRTFARQPFHCQRKDGQSSVIHQDKDPEVVIKRANRELQNSRVLVED